MTNALTDSNGTPASDAVPSQRVPAWRKLGLKLKFANEHTDQPTQIDSNVSINRKRPRDEDSSKIPETTGSRRVLRKRPRLDPPKPRPAKSNDTNDKPLSPSLKRDSNGIRKTVSFTSDTKAEDGDSSKSLIANWEAQHDHSTLLSSQPENPKPSKKKVAKSKKSNSRATTKKPHAALEYLTQFCESRTTWKYRKNQEVWILKHLFSIDHIPSSYDASLCQYLKGLKSDSTRSRLQREAEDIVQKDREQQIEYLVSTGSEDNVDEVNKVPAEMEDPERRRAYYEDSVRRFKRKVEQHLHEEAEEELKWVSPERLAKRRRAEIMLWATRATPSSKETTQGSEATTSSQSASRNHGSAREDGYPGGGLQKKRKNRTSVIELSSSSSSSEDESGDSSSESDNDNGGSGTGSQSRSRSVSTGTGTRTSAQTSASTRSQQNLSQDEDTGSNTSTSTSTSTSESSDDESGSDLQGAVGAQRRSKSIISISS
ncbi:hypothetical protein EPUS_04062 [Endocarpon pusillum Z07020]|uniref:WKF domain-containing protein n=1 Tax=Endocarpon pusillum (strain Z07020 / HMAS-L-300199) TaxID=1263415 RepID=U1HVP1_ENDPU|nr:uncharacterized protein EPUS_04062 [Endocarpon pusillum Z07020]ERF73439.1 hypothetical protein EPUS_04062 [Endocarpon pusillum Z07020]